MSSHRERAVTMMSAADADASCVGGQRHVPVKFGVSARSGCFLESAAAHLLRLLTASIFSVESNQNMESKVAFLLQEITKMIKIIATMSDFKAIMHKNPISVPLIF